jgi:hypothetical protein
VHVNTSLLLAELYSLCLGKFWERRVPVSHECNSVTTFLAGPALIDMTVLLRHGEFVLLAAE